MIEKLISVMHHDVYGKNIVYDCMEVHKHILLKAETNALHQSS